MVNSSVETQKINRYANAVMADPNRPVNGPEKIKPKAACPSRTRSGNVKKSHLSAAKNDANAITNPAKLPIQLIFISKLTDKYCSGSAPCAGTVQRMTFKK
jgi:hypothetical protein